MDYVQDRLAEQPFSNQATAQFKLVHWGQNRPVPTGEHNPLIGRLGGLFHFKSNVQCHLLALSGQTSRIGVCPLLE